MFDDPPLAVARLLRTTKRSLLVVDHACFLGQPAGSHLDVTAMEKGDAASWAEWALSVRNLRAQTERHWLPTVLRWFGDPPLVITNLTGREPIRAGASPHLYVECRGAIERLVCTGACGTVPRSSANDDLSAPAKRLVARYGRCKACNSPVVPSVGTGSHPDVRFGNDRALDAWRALPGRAVAIVIAPPGLLREHGLRVAEAASASIACLPDGRDAAQWVNEVDHAVVSLTWGSPGRVPIALADER